MNQGGFTALIISAGVMIFILIVASLYLFTTLMFPPKNEPLLLEKFISSPKVTPLDETAKTTKTSLPSPSPTIKPQYEINAPSTLKVDNPFGPSFISLKTKEEIRKQYEEVTSGKIECPGPCSFLINNPQVLETQFAFLEKAASSPNCAFSEDLKTEVEKDFMLFAGASESKRGIQGIYNPNLAICGIKYVGEDGYDVDTHNFRYKVGFIKDDKIIEINWELFPHRVFKDVDQLWNDIGWTEDGSCSAECTDNDTQYFENFKETDPVVQTVVRSYDQSVKSFKLK